MNTMKIRRPTIHAEGGTNPNHYHQNTILIISKEVAKNWIDHKREIFKPRVFMQDHLADLTAEIRVQLHHLELQMLEKQATQAIKDEQASRKGTHFIRAQQKNLMDLLKALEDNLALSRKQQDFVNEISGNEAFESVQRRMLVELELLA